MAETWFDMRDGALLIGAEAAGTRIDEGGPDVVKLGELLLARDFPSTPAISLNKISKIGSLPATLSLASGR